MSFSCPSARWKRGYYWCIAVYFRFLASKALYCTLYQAEHFSFSLFQPWILIILTCTQLEQLSIPNVLGAVLCLPRFWAHQSAVLTTGPSHMSAYSVVTHDCASIAWMSVVRVPTSPQPILAPSAANQSKRRLTRKKAQLKLFAFLRPHHTFPPMRQTPCSSLVKPAPGNGHAPPLWPSLQPSLPLEGPFLWPLLSMCH